MPSPRRAPRLSRLLVVLGSALALVAASCSASTGQERSSDDPVDTVVLQGVDSVEIDPFTDSVATAQFASFPSKVTDAVSAALAGFEAAADAMRTIPGDTPGLYGGTGDEATCDMDTLNGYLTDPANADKATAFAQVLGTQAAQIDATLDEFTTVILDVDMFVTNHGFTAGQANPFPAVLQAGTAVAVDRNGVPRVKCGCGNPLAPAPAGMIIDGDTPLRGEAWPGWNPADVVRAQPSAEPIDDFELIDVATGDRYHLPAGRVDATDDGDCVVDADGHGPDCDPVEQTDDDQDAPATTAAADPPTQQMGEDPSTMEDSDPEDRSWGVTGGAANPDEDFRVECAPNGQFEPVYGSGPYEMSSSVCTAAVHAGVITREQGGMVAVRQVTTGGPMGASTAHGVTTEPTGNPRGFFDFV